MFSRILSRNRIANTVEQGWYGWAGGYAERIQHWLIGQFTEGKEVIHSLWTQWANHPDHHLHMEALSMVALAFVFVYSGELYRGLQWVLTRLLFPQQFTRKNKYLSHDDDAPNLDSTEGSLEDDFDGTMEPFSANNKNTSNQPHQRRRSRRSYSSIERIPEDSVLRPNKSLEEEEEEGESGLFTGSEDDVATVGHSNASPSFPSSPVQGTELFAEHPTTKPLSPPTHGASSRLRRTTGPVSAASLRAKLQQRVKLPSQAQRLNAVSTSTLLKANSQTRVAMMSRRSQSFRGLNDDDGDGPPVSQLFEPHRRASSLSQLSGTSGREEPNKDKNPNYEVRIEPRKRTSPTSTSASHRRHLSSSLTTQAECSRSGNTGHRRHSSENARHLEDDCRLLERMARSKYGGLYDREAHQHHRKRSVQVVHTHKTIHVPHSGASTDSALSSP